MSTQLFHHSSLDELAALAAEAPVITTGRRTRGIRIDYTKVEGFPKDEESAEDDEEVEEKPTKSPKSSNKASKGKQTKESARTGNRISHESRKPTAQKVKATPSKKRVIESEEEEEDDDDDQEGSDNENDDAEDN